MNLKSVLGVCISIQWMTLLWYTFEKVCNVYKNTWGKKIFGSWQLLYAVVSGPENWDFYIAVRREKASELLEVKWSADF